MNESAPHDARGAKRRWRYAAAVVLVVGVGGGTAVASGELMSMTSVFDDLLNGSPARTEVADKIGRPLGASATSNGVTITAKTIVGDRTNYAVVFSIAKDDGTAFEDGSIIERTAHVSLSDLKMYEGGTPHVIAEGEWTRCGMDEALDSATVSPIALTLECTVHEVLNWEEQGSGRMPDRNQDEMDRFLDPS